MIFSCWKDSHIINPNGEKIIVHWIAWRQFGDQRHSRFTTRIPDVNVELFRWSSWLWFEPTTNLVQVRLSRKHKQRNVAPSGLDCFLLVHNLNSLMCHAFWGVWVKQQNRTETRNGWSSVKMHEWFLANSLHFFVCKTHQKKNLKIGAFCHREASSQSSYGMRGRGWHE